MAGGGQTWKGSQDFKKSNEKRRTFMNKIIIKKTFGNARIGDQGFSHLSFLIQNLYI
jgi:hypothetical protein